MERWQPSSILLFHNQKMHEGSNYRSLKKSLWPFITLDSGISNFVKALCINFFHIIRLCQFVYETTISSHSFGRVTEKNGIINLNVTQCLREILMKL